jgi:cytochrome o ubiquinol oxidase subunit 2
MQRRRRFSLAGLSSLFAAVFLCGCSSLILLEPKGPIGHAERDIIITAFVLMLIVVIPVVVMVVWFPKKYRESNTGAAYTPKWSYSGKLDLVIWLVPIAIITILGYITWTRTHHLDPFRPIDASVKPIDIQAVALDWKWLFIYPEHNVAAVNELVFPVDVPVSFRITSDTVMNSFFIPQLGSQIYAMAGMESRLHLMADKPGDYYGQNQQFSGNGYAYMQFHARAVSRGEFEGWLQKTGQSPERLDWARFEELQKPSIAAPVTYFSEVKPGLFDKIVGQFMSMSMKPDAATSSPLPYPSK